jgi:hypothetical protein
MQELLKSIGFTPAFGGTFTGDINHAGAQEALEFFIRSSEEATTYEATHETVQEVKKALDSAADKGDVHKAALLIGSVLEILPKSLKELLKKHGFVTTRTSSTSAPRSTRKSS